MASGTAAKPHLRALRWQGFAPSSRARTTTLLETKVAEGSLESAVQHPQGARRGGPKKAGARKTPAKKLGAKRPTKKSAT